VFAENQMESIVNRFLLTVVLGLVLIGPAWASNKDFSECEWVPGRLVVDFVEEVGTLHDMESTDGSPIKIGIPSVDALLQQYKITLMYRFADDKMLSKLKIQPDFYRYVVLQGPEDIDVLRMMRDFDANQYVAAADPDLLHKTFDIVPDDPMWINQWDKVCMNLPHVWDFSTGSEAIQVIAIDGGTCWQHPDFYGNLWVNPGEDLNGNGVPYQWDDTPIDTEDWDGIDNDGNGKIDDAIGWDFIRNIGGCVPEDDCDNQEDFDPIAWGDHGTHVLGLMGAQGNNGIGVTGVNWNVKIMASRAGYTRASDNQGLVVSTAAAACMTWALGLGVDVINMSYGSSMGGGPEQATIAAAWANGAIIVGAAGNDDHNTSPQYPAAFEQVIAVGSTDNASNCSAVSSFSNIGTWVECFAPGGGVMSTLCPEEEPSYGNNQGTSMASPNCAGVCALLWSIFPDYTNQQIKDVLLQGCVDISAENPDISPNLLGWGKVDVERSISMILPYLTVTGNWIEGDGDNDGRLESGESCDLFVSVANEAGWEAAQSLQLSFSVPAGSQLSISSGANFTLGTIVSGATVSTNSFPVHLVAAAEVHPEWAPINIHFTGANSLSVTRTTYVRIGRPDVLLVDDDNNQTFSNYFGTAMDNPEGTSRILYDVVNTRLDDALTYEDIEEYNQIVWVCGNENTNTLTTTDMAALATFMDNGGDVLVAGQGIDHDPTVTGNSFYADYLHAQSAGIVGGPQLVGVNGDVISSGQTLLLIGGACGSNGMVSPSVINPVDGGIGFYKYTGTENIAAVRYSAAPETHRSAYFAFAIEAACGNGTSTHHREVIFATMQWLGATAEGAEDQPGIAVPDGFALHANYPNPFNPDTQISFDIGTQSRVSIRIFDLLGREVAELVNGTLAAGTHTVTFSGDNLASGIYLVNMTADNFSATNRMVLLK
jgi:hypothetical protein